MQHGLKDFPHPKLNLPILAIGGRYILLKEERLPFEGEEILYLTGVAVFDTTCCGAGGCSYATVPGFVRNWKYKIDDNGNHVSFVEPILDDSTREKIKALILKKETVYQVDFL